MFEEEPEGEKEDVLDTQLKFASVMTKGKPLRQSVAQAGSLFERADTRTGTVRTMSSSATVVTFVDAESSSISGQVAESGLMKAFRKFCDLETAQGNGPSNELLEALNRIYGDDVAIQNIVTNKYKIRENLSPKHFAELKQIMLDNDFVLQFEEGIEYGNELGYEDEEGSNSGEECIATDDEVENFIQAIINLKLDWVDFTTNSPLKKKNETSPEEGKFSPEEDEFTLESKLGPAYELPPGEQPVLPPDFTQSIENNKEFRSTIKKENTLFSGLRWIVTNHPEHKERLHNWVHTKLKNKMYSQRLLKLIFDDDPLGHSVELILNTAQNTNQTDEKKAIEKANQLKVVKLFKATVNKAPGSTPILNQYLVECLQRKQCSEELAQTLVGVETGVFQQNVVYLILDEGASGVIEKYDSLSLITSYSGSEHLLKDYLVNVLMDKDCGKNLASKLVKNPNTKVVKTILKVSLPLTVLSELEKEEHAELLDKMLEQDDLFVAFKAFRNNKTAVKELRNWLLDSLELSSDAIGENNMRKKIVGDPFAPHINFIMKRSFEQVFNKKDTFFNYDFKAASPQQIQLTKDLLIEYIVLKLMEKGKTREEAEELATQQEDNPKGKNAPPADLRVMSLPSSVSGIMTGSQVRRVFAAVSEAPESAAEGRALTNQ